MKIVVHFLVFFCWFGRIYSQGWIAKINDPDFKLRLIKGLQVGDKMPELEFGTIINNKTGKSMMSEFKGKLVIFDFWNTWCKPCIEAMPKMEKLQKEFDGKIQIFLVNPLQTWEQIMKSKKIRYPDLPMIVKDSFGHINKFLQLFPARSTAHQVWIGPDGIIKLRGAPNNNTSEKIAEVLEGKSVFILRDNGTAPRFDPSVPYHHLLGGFEDTKMTFGSVFTRFNNEYDPETFGIAEDMVDSLAKTKRFTYVNMPALKLYSIALQGYLKPIKEKIIYGPYKKSQLGLYGYHTFILPKDTLRYTGEFLTRTENDSQYMKPKFCYEQIVPYGITEDRRLDFMFSDLNKYFGSLYGTNVKVITKNVKCFKLIKTANGFNAISKSEVYKKEEIILSGKKYFKYFHVDIGILRDIIEECKPLEQIFAKNFKENGPFLLLNNSGISRSEMIDIVLPDPLNIISMEDLRQALHLSGLDILEQNESINFIQITDDSIDD